ncbi:MAG TPA: NAD-dependent epimerase/dehydratase family protein [Candidatus Dormibacteraeota bacterium]|nr:NAD-dependent epimerase/dehydratase family protein [Candidatus Dormibacteraeota bacterium]
MGVPAALQRAGLLPRALIAGALHLVIGAGEFLGDHVSRALAADVPIIELNADADEETLNDAISSVEVVLYCAQSWSPARRAHFRKRPPPTLQRVLAAAQHAKVRRIVHVSTADVYGPDHNVRINEKSRLKPIHAYERLRLNEEQWLLESAGKVEVVIVRPARIFGAGEDWILPRLMGSLARGRVWLPGGGRAKQTFVSADDVGRACLAASDRGRPGHSYLVGGFDASWRDLLESAIRAVGVGGTIVNLPYDLLYLRAVAMEAVTAPGAVVWPGTFAIDVLGKPHYCDDSQSRRDLTWSPSVGSFEQEMPRMAAWLSRLPDVAAALAAESMTLTSPPR